MKLFSAMFVVFCSVGLAQAQENCQIFKGMLQGRLELPAGWVAEVRGVLGEVQLQHVLGGTLRAVEMGSVVSDGGIGSELDSKFILDFGNDGTITFFVPRSLLMEPPGAPRGPGAGTYMGGGKILSGTGRFARATGTILMSGPYTVWFDKADDPSTVQGRWNSTVTMRVCNVQ